jgi:hypothetical protein
MPFTILDASEPVITVKISGELGKVEVSHIQAAALEVIQGCGKISALFILENFRGWKREGDWGDITFMTAHDEDIAKIAVVREEEWRDLIYLFLRRRISSSPNRNISFPPISQKRSPGSKPTFNNTPITSSSKIDDRSQETATPRLHWTKVQYTQPHHFDTRDAGTGV